MWRYRPWSWLGPILTQVRTITLLVEVVWIEVVRAVNRQPIVLLAVVLLSILLLLIVLRSIILLPKILLPGVSVLRPDCGMQLSSVV